MQVIQGRIDEQGRVLLPVILIASDGIEIEVEASVGLGFGGALAIAEDLARSLGWRCLGARRVIAGLDTRLVDHYIGTVSMGSDPQNVVVLGGVNTAAVLGQCLMAGRQLSLNFGTGEVTLT